MQEVIIVGGGVSGLAAANALAEFGIDVLLVDGSTYPGHRVCGEFFSSESLPILANWLDVPMKHVHTLKLTSRERAVSLPIELNSAACSRWQVDRSLAERATRLGVTMRTGQTVETLAVPNSLNGYYNLRLSSGETIKSRILVVATGKVTSRFRNGPPIPMRHRGFKAHYTGIDLDGALEMYLIPGGYVGLVNIDENIINVAGLVVDRGTRRSVETVIDGNCRLRERLGQGRMAFEGWMVVRVPEFGRRPIPNWPNAYFIGDAAGTPPPATGAGLTMGITSGLMAADYIRANDPSGFRIAWRRCYARTFQWGRILHRLFMSAFLRNYPHIVCRIPMIATFLHARTRVGPAGNDPRESFT